MALPAGIDAAAAPTSIKARHDRLPRARCLRETTPPGTLTDCWAEAPAAAPASVWTALQRPHHYQQPPHVCCGASRRLARAWPLISNERASSNRQHLQLGERMRCWPQGAHTSPTHPHTPHLSTPSSPRAALSRAAAPKRLYAGALLLLHGSAQAPPPTKGLHERLCSCQAGPPLYSAPHSSVQLAVGRWADAQLQQPTSAVHWQVQSLSAGCSKCP